MSMLVIAIEKFLSRLTTYIIALTELEQRDYIQRRVASKDQMRRIDQGLELEKFAGAATNKNAARSALGIKPEEKVVGMIARLEPIKGPRFLIEAAGIIAGKIGGVKFLIVGEGSLRNLLERRTVALGLEQNFIFAGWRQDIPAMLSAMDILALPSLNEAVGIVLLEAQAAGVSVVATEVGGIPEIIKDRQNGLLVAPADPQALANALATLLQDEGLRSRLSSCARAWISGRFKVSDMVDQTSALYQQAYRNKGAARS
jgi:glycosyltransferase involved in cell wall biosynthesis